MTYWSRRGLSDGDLPADGELTRDVTMPPAAAVLEDMLLGAAWRRAEALLPRVTLIVASRSIGDGYIASTAHGQMGTGTTPTAALNALADILEGRTP